MNKTLGIGLSFLFAFSFAACSSGPTGRLKSDSEEDMVGNRAAGAETYDRLVAGAVEKLLSGPAAAFTGTGQKKIAVLPIRNEGNEELADWKAQLYQIVGSTINQSARFRTINKDFLDVAFREAQISTNDVYLPRGRRALAAALEQQGVPVELLLLPTLTTGTTNAGQGESQKNYLLGLVLVDIASGEEVANVTSPRIRKEYTR